MTVAVASRKLLFPSISGSTGPFSFNFRILMRGVGSTTPQITVTKYSAAGVPSNLSYPADYSFVASSGGLSGGTITLSVAGGTGESLLVSGATPVDQPTGYSSLGKFFPEKHEDSYDQGILIAQEQQQDISRAIKQDLAITTAAPTMVDFTASDGAVPMYESATNRFVVGPTASAISSAQSNAVLAQQWATLTTGLVAATDYSSKAYAIGGTGVTGTIGSAKEWATSASKPDGVNESAKTYAAQALASASSLNFRYCGTATGSANALTLTPGTALGSYTGALIEFIFASANTTEAMTANVSTLGNKNLKVVSNGTKRDPAIGMFQAGMHGIAQYDGTDLVVINYPWDNQATDVAAAATVALASATGNFANLTGTGGPVTAITGITKGRRMLLRHTGIHTLTHAATLFLLNNATNIVTAAGDISEWVSDGTNVYMTRYHRASAAPLSMTGVEASIASNTTTDLNTALSNVASITGTTTITGFGSNASTSNPIYFIRFTGILTLTHNGTSLIIPGAASVTTAAGDMAIVKYEGSGNWRVLNYVRASGLPIVSTGLTLMAKRTPGAVTTDTQTGIPSTAKRVTINFQGLTKAGTGDFNVQIGPSGGVVGAGYVGVSRGTNATAGMAAGTSWSALGATCGSILLTLMDSTNNVWAWHGCPSGGGFNVTMGGYIALSGALERIMITDQGGAPGNFSAGSWNVCYE